MSHIEASSPLGKIVDSAVLLAVVTGVLFIWGVSANTMMMFELGIPFVFARALPIESHIAMGGLYGVFAGIVVTILYIVWRIVLRFAGARVHAALQRRRISAAGRVLIALYAFLFFTGIVIPATVRPVLRGGVRHRVEAVRPSPGAVLPPQLVGSYVVAVNEHEYVFIRPWASRDAIALVISRDNIETITVRTEYDVRYYGR